MIRPRECLECEAMTWSRSQLCPACWDRFRDERTEVERAHLSQRAFESRVVAVHDRCPYTWGPEVFARMRAIEQGETLTDRTSILVQLAEQFGVEGEALLERGANAVRLPISTPLSWGYYEAVNAYYDEGWRPCEPPKQRYGIY